MMRYFCLVLLLTSVAPAQSTSTTYRTDINGNRQVVSTSDTSAQGATTTRTQRVNGGRAPNEETSERVIRDDATGKVVERIVKKYDTTGRLAATERVVSEETKQASGGKLLKETTSRSEANSPFRDTERRTSDTSVSGQTSTTNTTIDRPNVNGGFAAAEKRTLVATGPKDNQQSSETIDRPDPNGRFRPAERRDTTTTTTGATTTNNTATYQSDQNGKFQLARQSVATTTKDASGGSVTSTDVFAADQPGYPRSTADKPHLQEQQTTQRKVGPDGSVTETVMVRSATLNDPSRLSAPKVVSETVCKGQCIDPATVAPAKPVTLANAKDAKDAKAKGTPRP